MGARLIVVEPHYDDAVFSLAEFMASFEGDIRVLTVFGSAPPDGDAKKVDEVLMRQAEQSEAMAIVGASWFAGPLADGKWVTDRSDVEWVEAAAFISWHMADFQATHLLFPVGLVHEDHQNCAGLSSWIDRSYIKVGRTKFGRYEDLPYAVMYRWTYEAPNAVLEGPWQTNLALKRRAVACYASQIQTEDIERNVYVPERVWWQQ